MKNMMTAMKTLAVAGMTMGLALGAQAELCNDCITFSSKGKFTVQMMKGSQAPAVNLEYSTDKTSWSAYDPAQAYEAAQSGGAGDYMLYWRGTNNVKFASASVDTKATRFTITTNGVDLVACSGNVETLLDYKEVAAGGHPQMGDYAFYRLFYNCDGIVPTIQLSATNLAQYCYYCMFQGCTALTAAPELPATNLAQSCYYCMFNGCTSLTAAPELPATNLADNCYRMMFYGCTALTAAPELPATNLAQYCYQQMFQGCTALTAAPKLPATNLMQSCYQSMFKECTSLTAIPTLDVSVVAKSCCQDMFRRCTNLVVNTDGPGKAWSIPAGVEIQEGAEPTANKYWATDMFKSTAGTITNSTEVTPGTTYYVASAPVTLDVAAVDNATFAVTTNDAPATVPCTINYITPVSVTYTAAPGYAFPGGKAEFTTNVTASAETLTVTLPKDQWPVPPPPVKVEVSNPDGGTAAVYTNEVLVTGGEVVSNSIAHVVYTVTNGKFFENGETVVTNTLDTTTNPATDKSAYVPAKAGTPTVQLGIVAQRYPWNGTLDVQYRATYVKNTPAVVTVTIPGRDPIGYPVVISAGTNTLAVTLPAEIRAKDAKVTLNLN